VSEFREFIRPSDVVSTNPKRREAPRGIDSSDCFPSPWERKAKRLADFHGLASKLREFDPTNE